MPVLSSDEVFDVILEEREYQIEQARSPARPDMKPVLTVGEGLLAMRHCLEEAQRRWYADSDPHSDAMHFVRKIAGLALQLGENYGMPRR